MERLNSGAPFLKDHRASIDSQVGVIERAWIEGNNAMATIRLSEREDVEPLFQDIKSGILRNISVGYRVHKYEEVAVGEGDLPVYRATDWEPMEISLVAIGFDQKAQTRNGDENEHNECEVVSQSRLETLKEKEEMKDQKEQVVQPEEIRGEGIALEKKRCSEIMASVKKAGLDVEFASKLIAEGNSVEEARGLIIDELATRQSQVQTQAQVPQVEITRDEKQTRKEAMVEAILHRGLPSKFKATEKGQKYRSASLLDMAREFAGRDFGLSKSDIVARAFHTTSDLPAIMLDAANKVLQKEYAEAESTFEPLVQRVSLSDFKYKNVIKMGDAPKLELVPESGEIKKGTMSDGKERYKLGSYGKIVAITREVVINDDLDALLRMPAAFGRRARELEADLVFALITSNPTMGDSVALFHATHKNLGSAAAIAVASIGKGYEAMRKQTGLDGAKIDVRPQHLLVPVALETVALQFVASNQLMLANQNSNVNPYAGRLNVIADPRLDDNSATNWYMASDKSQLANIELASLEGAGPQVLTQEGWSTSGVEIKCLYDVAAGLVDFRGLYKNPHT